MAPALISEPNGAVDSSSVTLGNITSTKNGEFIFTTREVPITALVTPTPAAPKIMAPSATAPDTATDEQSVPKVSIAPLLKQLAAPNFNPANIDPEDIALAWARIFENRLSATQLAALLTLLHSTGLDKNPRVIAKCAQRMRDAATPVDEKRLNAILGKRKRTIGSYRGGVCDIVGTGGDHHSTFNVSTTASILVCPILAIAKHGNRSSTSLSGSADVLKSVKPSAPRLDLLTAEHLPDIYEHSNYAFLLAPNFHSGMKYAATVRKELGLRTIFNLLGPLANPTESSIEARMLGVAYQELGPVFAQALQLSKVSKALIVCGNEDLDEISCAGPTSCWWIKEVSNREYLEEMANDSDGDEEVPVYRSKVESFTLRPSDFGLETHSLSKVGGGKLPDANAEMLMKILRNQLPPNDPLLHFVLMNTAALFVVSGVCDADESEFGGEVIRETGPAGGRWKEGVRLARWCIESGQALEQFEKFIAATQKLVV